LVGGEPAPGEKIKHRYFFKPLHVELLLNAASLSDDPIDQAPAAVAELIERTARRMHAPYETEREIRAAAERQVDEMTARVEASNQSGGLKHWNTRYRQYRLEQVSRAERAIPFSAFLEQFVITPTVRNVAATGRMV
jgi:hypothetical protein